MSNPQTQNVILALLGGIFFLAGLVFTGRAWSMGYRWKEPDENATAHQIEGTAHLRFGTALVVGGGGVAGFFVFFALASKGFWNQESVAGALLVALIGLLAIFTPILLSARKLYRRASNVRVRDSLPRRRRLYLAWPQRDNPPYRELDGQESPNGHKPS